MSKINRIFTHNIKTEGIKKIGFCYALCYAVLCHLILTYLIVYHRLSIDYEMKMTRI